MIKLFEFILIWTFLSCICAEVSQNSPDINKVATDKPWTSADFDPTRPCLIPPNNADAKTLAIINKFNNKDANITEVLDTLLSSTPNNTNNVTSTSFLRLLEKGIKDSLLANLSQTLANINETHNSSTGVDRSKRSMYDQCVSTMTTTATVTGTAVGTTAGGTALSVIPVLGTMVGACIGAKAGAVLGQTAGNYLATTYCPRFNF